jgi:hypothetical protein
MPSQVSDGHHTFEELYKHRYLLFIALCKLLAQTKKHYIWRSRLHSDGTMFDNSFVLGINEEQGEQITYHLPLNKWEDTSYADTLGNAPQYDGHTPNEVLSRLEKLIANLKC